MRAGAAFRELPVGTGRQLAGYRARPRPASGTLRPLEVDALVVEAGGRRAALVSLDLIALDRAWVDAARRRVAQETGIPEELVLLAATHTHSGPVGFGLDRADAGDLRRLAEIATAAAVREACERTGPVEATLHRAAVPGVAAHRGRPGEPVDERATLLELRGEDGAVRGALWHFACHPTVLGADGSAVSPDLPGEVRARLRERAGAALPVVTFTGAAGDVSTRFTRREQTPAELARLAEAIVAALDRPGDPMMLGAPDIASVAVRLPAAPPDPGVEQRLEAARSALSVAERDGAPPGELRRLATNVAGIEKRVRRGAGGEDRTALVHALALPPLGLVGVPGELFARDGMAIAERSPFAPTLVVGYAGDHLGYLPSSGAAGYEADSATVAPGAGERVGDAALEALRKVAFV